MYTTERLNDKSYNEIQTLYKESFGSNHSIEFITKKYNTLMFGEKNVGIIAQSESNEPAAYYGVLPLTLHYKNKDYLIAQSGDTMTSPKHRKKGLFVKLAKETYQLSKDIGIKMVFGFPNEFSYPGFKKKLEWIFHDYMYNFSINNTVFPLCELATKYKSLENWYRKFSQKKIAKYEIPAKNENLECFSSDNTIAQIKKDEKFFKYKLNNTDISLIKINGYTIMIKPKGHLFIGAVGIFDEEEIKDFLKTIKKLSVKLACKKTVFTLSKNHWLYGYLSQEIKPEKSLPIGFYIINKDIDLSIIQFERADYDTF